METLPSFKASFAPSLHREPLDSQLPAWGVSALESHHARDFQMKIAAHDFFQLLYVLRGQGTLHLPAFRNLWLEAGDVALLPAHVAHGLQDDAHAPLSIYAVNCSVRLLEWLPPLSCPLRVRQEPLQTLMPELLRRMLLEQSLRKSGFEAMMNGLALQILSAACRAHYAPVREFSALDSPAKARVALYFTELPRTFTQNESAHVVAARLGLSRRHFSTLFREIAGDSWLSYVRGLRVEHAQKLLLESGRTVLAIAFECGFEELSSFYRAFKAVSGTSPEQWRKSMTQ